MAEQRAVDAYTKDIRSSRDNALYVFVSPRNTFSRSFFLSKFPFLVLSCVGSLCFLFSSDPFPLMGSIHFPFYGNCWLLTIPSRVLWALLLHGTCACIHIPLGVAGQFGPSCGIQACLTLTTVLAILSSFLMPQTCPAAASREQQRKLSKPKHELAVVYSTRDPQKNSLEQLQ
jgi:hypothetical protein